MKYTNIIKVCVLLLVLALSDACQKYYPMVPPPVKDQYDDLDEELGASMPIFVTQHGAGSMSGNSWENAMDLDGLRDLLTNHVNISRRTICVAEGNYLVSQSAGEGISISKDIYCVKGGFPSNSTGTDVSKCDPDKYATIFSGDVNGNSIADSGDCTLFKLTSGHVTFEGCRFCFGYLDASLSQTLKGQIGAGIYINGVPTATSFTAIDCEFKGNKTVAVGSGGGVAGGPCALLQSGYFKARDCRFVNNQSGNDGRGGALRVNNDAGCIFLDRCLLSGNTFTGKFGMAIQMSAGYICMNNTTIVDNPGNCGPLNGGAAFFISNSTIVGDSNDESDYAFRCESNNGSDSKWINSVFANEKSNGFGININHNSPDIASMGWNVYQGIKYGDNDNRNPTIFTPASSDVLYTGGALAGSLSGDAWVYDVDVLNMSVYANVRNIIDAAMAFKPNKSGYAMPNLGEEFIDWIGEGGFAVDCRGESRNPDKLQPGSYDAKLN